MKGTTYVPGGHQEFMPASLGCKWDLWGSFRAQETMPAAHARLCGADCNLPRGDTQEAKAKRGCQTRGSHHWRRIRPRAPFSTHLSPTLTRPLDVVSIGSALEVIFKLGSILGAVRQLSCTPVFPAKRNPHRNKR